MTMLAEASGATVMRPEIDIDADALARWMRGNVEGYRGTPRIARFSGGQSNPTYRIDGTDRAYVLRRKPSGPLLSGAHAIDREVRVMAALHDTGFPVPRVHALCEDVSVIGTSFYVMDMVDGRIFWDATFPGLPPAERAACFDSMNDTIARLHALDVRALGLDGYGRQGGYVARQIARWSRQYLDDTEAGRDPNMDRLIEWLPANAPVEEDDTRIVHGDFRVDNLIFHPVEPRVVAVLDWELSTLGSPVADFANSTMMYCMPPHIIAGLAGVDLASLGLPGEHDYVDAYCRRVGRDELPDYDFYRAFAVFRLAAIFHGIKGRLLRGNAASAQAKDRAAALPELAALAWAQARRAEAI